MAIHFLVDANLSPDLADLLPSRLNDVRVEHVLDHGYGNATDEQIVALALEQGAILLTEGRGFDAGRNPTGIHPGVIVIPRPLAFPDVIGPHLRRLWPSAR